MSGKDGFGPPSFPYKELNIFKIGRKNKMAIILNGISSKKMRKPLEAKMEICEAAEVPYIFLKHWNNGTSPLQLTQFQGITITKSRKPGAGLSFIKKYVLDENGKPTTDCIPTVFEIYGIDEVACGIVVDTKYNREQMAREFYQGPSYRIKDPQIRAEIGAMAKRPVRTVTPEQKKNMDLTAENKYLKIQLEELKGKKEEVNVQDVTQEDATLKTVNKQDVTLEDVDKQDPKWKRAFAEWKKMPKSITILEKWKGMGKNAEYYKQHIGEPVLAIYNKM
ncbi:MAG: hypothetical protein ACTSYW_00390 [Candidatus Heimdallarchaeota archaeon]